MPEYRVALRHTTLASAVTLQSMGEDQHFIPSAAPPPAHSILTLHHDDEVQYFLVDRAIESDTAEQPAGIIGRFTDAEAHEQASQLGSEHLEDGEVFTPEGSAPQMAVPAPVVDPDPSGDLDPEERARLEESQDEAHSAEANSMGAPQGEADAEASAEAASSAEADAAAKTDEAEEKPTGRRRKRRGRKRR